jgi:hypothetical protein
MILRYEAGPNPIVSPDSKKVEMKDRREQYGEVEIGVDLHDV